VLFRVAHAAALWRDLLHNHSVLVRDFSRSPGLEDCLRVTVGSDEENARFLAAVEDIMSQRRATEILGSVEAHVRHGTAGELGVLMTRSATIRRETRETDIEVSCDLDTAADAEVSTGIPFFDHMLDALGRHGLMTLRVWTPLATSRSTRTTPSRTSASARQAFAEALGDKTGIRRYGSAAIPMDEALVLAAVDVSGRGQLTTRSSCRSSSSARSRPRSPRSSWPRSPRTRA
jgi:hypothetical protein